LKTLNEVVQALMSKDTEWTQSEIKIYGQSYMVTGMWTENEAEEPVLRRPYIEIIVTPLGAMGVK